MLSTGTCDGYTVDPRLTVLGNEGGRRGAHHISKLENHVQGRHELVAFCTVTKGIWPYGCIRIEPIPTYFWTNGEIAVCRVIQTQREIIVNSRPRRGGDRKPVDIVEPLETQARCPVMIDLERKPLNDVVPIGSSAPGSTFC